VAFTRWDPLRDLLALHEQLGHLVGTDAPGWTPPVDLYETADEYVLTAELPGLTREQIDIHAEERRIVIRGARSVDPGRDIPCEQYHRVERGHGRFSRAFSLPESIDRVERGHGRFSRAFSLPESIDVDGVTADLKDGILTVAIPKARDRGTRRIDVG
jgi:HSP20 family protein